MLIKYCVKINVDLNEFLKGIINKILKFITTFREEIYA